MYAVYVCALDPAYYSDAVVHGFCTSPADIRSILTKMCTSVWMGNGALLEWEIHIPGSD